MVAPSHKSKSQNPTPESSVHREGSPRTDLARLICNTRVAAGLPLHDVANYVGVTVELLERFEAGVQSIPLHHVYALANCLNISPRDVLDLGLGTPDVSA